MCRTAVTLGGGITITNGSRVAARAASAVNTPCSDHLAYQVDSVVAAS